MNDSPPDTAPAPIPAGGTPADGTPTGTTPRAATDIGAYTFFSRDTVRFSDVDRYRHINNVAIATYCETGRVEFAEFLWPGSTSGDGDGWVIAKLGVSFLNMAYYPGDVVVGSRVEHIGRTSCRIGQGLFKDGVCFATSEAVLVWIDLSAGGRPAPLPEALVEQLRRNMT
ncbi:MAG: acyl-CoA thioesterase [Rhodospirillales bacterium]